MTNRTDFLALDFSLMSESEYTQDLKYITQLSDSY